MKRILFIICAALLSSAAAAEKLPKKVAKSRQAVARVMTYSNGTLKSSATALFVGGGGDVLVPYAVLAGADSAVVIDAKGKARSVRNIVGANSVYDYAKVRVERDKKIVGLPLSSSAVAAGDALFMLSYAKKGAGSVEGVKVSAVDSLYSHAYYTLDMPMQEKFTSLPLVNANGELVAMMQPAASGDTLKSYAIGATMSNELTVTAMNYGRGYFEGMKIRTMLPAAKEEALSCLYMQTMVGDSASYRAVINDFMESFPDSHEGYVCDAEHRAVYDRDMPAADKSWEKALTLTDNRADVYFNKCKVINAIVGAGDTLSHEMLTFANALECIDRAIGSDSLSLYVNYKADMLLGAGRHAEAYDNYISLVKTDARSAELFARAAQCKGSLKEYDEAVMLIDSAIVCLGGSDSRNATPYILTRALLNSSAGRYRAAVFDYNKYEQAMGITLGASFYTMRAQDEVRSKMFQQALNDYEKAISIEPRNAAIYFEKAMLCYRVQKFDDAADALSYAKELAPEAPDVYYLLGCVYLKTGDTKLAESNLQKAASLGHPDAESKLKEAEK